jgi:hypothetical protein
MHYDYLQRNPNYHLEQVMKVSFFPATPAGWPDDTVVEVHAGVVAGQFMVVADGRWVGDLLDRGETPRGFRWVVSTRESHPTPFTTTANCPVEAVSTLLETMAADVAWMLEAQS